MLGYVADSEYGIPRRCPCGGRIIDEVCGKEEYDTHPGKRFFSCINYEVRDTSTDAYISIEFFFLCCLMFFFVVPKADGFHYRQHWVIGVQEEIERQRKRVEEADEVIKLVPNLNKQIESVEVSVIF